MVSFEEASFISAAKVVAAAEEIADQLSTRAMAVVKYLGTHNGVRKELRDQILVWDVYQPRLVEGISVSVDKSENDEDIVVMNWNQFYSSLQAEDYSHVEITLGAFFEIESRINI